MSKRSKTRVDVREVAAEIVRRAAGADGNGSSRYVVRRSDPPTAHEQLQLAAARILRRPIAIMPAKRLSVGEWIARFGLP